MDNRDILITNKTLIRPKHQCEHEPYEYFKYEATPRNEGHQCYVAVYEIPPRKANYPYHHHLKNEEVFYIISGQGILETPDGEKPIKAGDIIICPPSEKGAHRLINSSEKEMLVYIDFDTVNFPEVVFYPRSDKVGITENGQSNLFFRRNSNVGYYDGE